MGKIGRVIYLLCMLIAVFYYSWLPNPRLESEISLPNWIGKWADSHENIRTGIPFLLGGLFVPFQKRSPITILLLWVLLFFLIVTFAELGQLLLPNRSFDWEDIFWGVTGGLIGLVLSFMYSNYKY